MTTNHNVPTFHVTAAAFGGIEKRAAVTPDLCEYLTGDRLRDATLKEDDASRAAAEEDGGHGIIEVEIPGRGRIDCYTEF